MIAYDDLVVALSSWRASQGLPSNAVNFLSADTGSVDLALPIADPGEAMELETGEVQSLDEEYAAEEYAVEEEVVEEYAVEEYAVEEGVASADHFDAATGEDFIPGAVPFDDAASPVHALSYDDEESEQTAIASDFESAYDDGASAIPSELASPESDDGISVAVDDEILSVNDVEAEEVLDALPSAAPAEAHTEEGDVLSEFAAGEEEGPTQFGDLDRESTEMGVGLETLQQPGPRRDPEE